ncbi:MAG: hypothetical protein RH945_11080, partial [Hyphomonas sp.]
MTQSGSKRPRRCSFLNDMTTDPKQNHLQKKQNKLILGEKPDVFPSSPVPHDDIWRPVIWCGVIFGLDEFGLGGLKGVGLGLSFPKEFSV